MAVPKDPLYKSLQISGAGARAQSKRLKVIAENLAGSQVTPTKPGEKPYTRKRISFQNKLDRHEGINKVHVKSIHRDHKTPYPEEYDPTHPAADENGMVKMPNVNWQTEVRDYNETLRSHMVNLNLVHNTRRMIKERLRMIGRG